MKTFTATQLNKKPQEVFAAAKEGGTAIIVHDRYPGTFVIVWTKEELTEQLINDAINSDPAPDQ